MSSVFCRKFCRGCIAGICWHYLEHQADNVSLKVCWRQQAKVSSVFASIPSWAMTKTKVSKKI
jgi:hypothetical protein